MEESDISRLASYLRDVGDKILNSGTKLSLTVPLLHKLNQSFPLIVENDNHNTPTSFQFHVINTNNSKFAIFHDLAFLHDFFQKTVNLKLTNGDAWSAEHSQDVIDISKFGMLRGLELTHVPATKIVGIQCLRHQLETLSCSHCFGKLEEILKHCGGDQSTGLVWNELHKAVFSHNALESLDTSIDYIPFVQDLDLSHNQLTNVDPIIFLPNLRCLKLSYNLLQSIPSFSKSASQKLQIVILKCNHLEDITGLSSFENLQYLDLSCNCLMDHASSLKPLHYLRALTWLSLEGNPLSFHKKHRTLTAQCLSSNASSCKFVLDMVELSKAERFVVGTMIFKPVFVTSTPSSSVTSSANIIQPQRRSGKVREAFIADDSEIIEPECSSILETSYEASGEHLETKKQIEIIRERFGEENWLHSHGGSYVQDLLGLPTVVGPRRQEAEEQEEKQEVEERIPVEEVGQEEATSRQLTPDSEDTDSQVSVEESSDEIEGSVYSVRTEGDEELFLEVSSAALKEREMSRGHVLAAWTLDTLGSCTLLTAQLVQLTFNTVRRDKQMRKYTMDPREAQELVSRLSAQLNEESLGLRTCRCLQCAAEFSVDTANHCPVCSSGLIVEADQQSENGSETVQPSDSDEIEVISNPSQSSIEVLDTVVSLLPDITESSSSGSMADSVCTTYEQRTTSITDSSTGVMQYSYEDYSQVDHRLKLHVYMRVFREDQEQLTMLVRARVVCVEGCVEACVVVSTHHVYVMEVTALESEEPESWLRQRSVYSLSHLQMIYPLPFHLGIGLLFNTSLQVLVIMPDSRRTRQLLAFLPGLSLPVELLPAQDVSQLLDTLCSFEDNSSTLVTIYSSCRVSGRVYTKPGAVVVMSTSLVLTQGSLLWLAVDSEEKPQALVKQSLSNLIEVEADRTTLTLNFLDESREESDDTWVVEMESESELKHVLIAIREPWEDLFGIPLNVTRKP